jgi:hypothetical protein
MYSGQINLIKKVIDALVLVCESSDAVSYFQGIELEMVSQLLALLIEVMQGPCAGNQEEIVESDAIVAISIIIAAQNSNDMKISLTDPGHMGIRGQACVLLAACLEGREDVDCHKVMMRKLEVSALCDHQDVLETDVRKMRVYALRRLLDSEEAKRLSTLQAALVAVVTVVMELGHEKKAVEKVEATEEPKTTTTAPPVQGVIGDDGQKYIRSWDNSGPITKDQLRRLVQLKTTLEKQGVLRPDKWTEHVQFFVDQAGEKISTAVKLTTEQGDTFIRMLEANLIDESVAA